MRRSLTDKQIIRLKTDIDRVFKAGKRKSLSCFKVYSAANGKTFSRFIVIPVRHYGNSVQRNHIRRQVKEIWRLNQEKIPSGFDYAIVVYPDSTLSYREKEDLLLRLIEKSTPVHTESHTE